MYLMLADHLDEVNEAEQFVLFATDSDLSTASTLPALGALAPLPGHIPQSLGDILALVYTASPSLRSFNEKTRLVFSSGIREANCSMVTLPSPSAWVSFSSSTL